MGGGLNQPDLNRSKTLLSGDGQILVELPEHAKYLIRARTSESGRTEIETCRFAVSRLRIG